MTEVKFHFRFGDGSKAVVTFDDEGAIVQAFASDYGNIASTLVDSYVDFARHDQPTVHGFWQELTQLYNHAKEIIIEGENVIAYLPPGNRLTVNSIMATLGRIIRSWREAE